MEGAEVVVWSMVKRERLDDRVNGGYFDVF